MNDRNNVFEKIYEIVAQSPYGKVTSYGAIAEKLGSASGARIVGWAMNASHIQDFKLPAHRVVNRNGLLTGKHNFATPTLMQELLEREGIIVIDNKIVDFEKHFWKPK